MSISEDITLFFLEILKRAEQTGPICEENEWNLKVIPMKISEKLREYGLNKTYNKDNPIPSDDGLADDFWKAGFELAVDTGVLCMDSRRIIKFTESELKEFFKKLPKEVKEGAGKEEINIKIRNVEDKRPPVCFYGPIGIDITEDLFIPVVTSVIQYPVIDKVHIPELKMIHGKEIRAGAPSEVIGIMYQLKMYREAAKIAQRTTLSEEKDWEHCNMNSELKTNYQALDRVARMHSEGKFTYSLAHSIIGGYAGGIEGSALARIANTILVRPVHLAAITHTEVFDVRYMGSSGRETSWANSISSQAISRNSQFLQVGASTTPSAGLCTKMLLYEAAVLGIRDSINGNAMASGIRPCAGRYENYGSGLENKFTAEVVKSVAGMKRQNANEIVKELIQKYEANLKDPPKGKPFQECFDIKTLKPTNEWMGIYNTVWKELEDLGVDLNITGSTLNKTSE